MRDLFEDLNPRQKEAVRFTEKPLFVFAGPGTGKTRVTTYKLAHLIKDRGFRPSQVLALAFSEKAAREMKKKVEKLLPGVPDVRISTFHSFCYEVIRDNSLELGINAGGSVITEEYQQAFLLANLDALGLESFKVPTWPIDLAKVFQGAIARFKQENISLEKLENYLEKHSGSKDENIANLRDLAKAYRAYERFKEDRGLIDFGDMQMLTLGLFEERPDILGRYQESIRYVIVDEFQDTDFIQLRILFRLAPGGNITIVGDDDQSIYRFRGAYLTNMKEFDRFYTDRGIKPERIVLDTNYRCTGNIQKVATNLIRNNPEREDKDIRTEKADLGPVRVVTSPTDWDQALWIVNTMAELHDDGRAWEDMAILVRRRVDALPVIEAMEKRRIPFEILGSREYFKEPVIRAVVSYLKFLADPDRNQPSLGHVLLRPVHGIRVGELKRLTRHAKDKAITLWEALGSLDDLEGDSRHLRRFRAEMDGMFSVLGEGGLQKVVRALLFGKDFFRPEIARNGTDNIRLLNRFLMLTAGFLEIYPDGDLDDFLLHLDALKRLGLEDEEREPGEGRVHLLTVHGAKGMEFPVVFVPCLNENRFPSRYRAYKLEVPDELADGIRPGGGPKELHEQEERRLCYVAVTRAMDTLYLSCCGRYGDNRTDTAVSRYLKEITAAGAGFERTELGAAEDEGEDVSDSVESAIKGRVVSSLERGEWQDAVDAVTALALRNGAPVEDLKVASDLDLDEYVGELDLAESEPALEHAEEAEYSPSKLGAYEKCPRGYWYSVVLGIPGEVRTYFDLGHVVHEVIEVLSRKIMNGEEVTEKEALELLDRLWTSSTYTLAEKEKQDRADAEEMIRGFLVRQTEKKGRIIDVEMYIGFNLEGRKIRGRVDRVDDVGESLEVIDYKTGKSKVSKPELRKDLQMCVYWQGVEETFGKKVSGVEHWYLRDHEERRVELTPDDLKEARQKALEIIKAIESREFQATPNFNTCKNCDYGDLCDENGKK